MYSRLSLIQPVRHHQSWKQWHSRGIQLRHTRITDTERCWFEKNQHFLNEKSPTVTETVTVTGIWYTKNVTWPWFFALQNKGERRHMRMQKRKFKRFGAVFLIVAMIVTMFSTVSASADAGGTAGGESSTTSAIYVNPGWYLRSPHRISYSDQTTPSTEESHRRCSVWSCWEQVTVKPSGFTAATWLQTQKMVQPM